MLKKLFLILFLLQTLASSAWGDVVGGFTLSPAEQVEMKVMHHVRHMTEATLSDRKVVSAKIGPCLNHQQTMTCDDCNSMDCHNLLCASIHSSPVFNLVAQFTVDTQPMTFNTSIVLDEPVKTTTSQPELPPPNHFFI